MRGLRELYEVRQLSHSAKTSPPNPDPDPDPNPDPDLDSDLDPGGDPGASNLDGNPDPEA